MAILDATHSAVHRGWLLGARAWLMGREWGAVRLGRRLCYGCKAARPIDGPTASLCPRGCGGVPVPPAEDGVHDMWFCSAACYAASAGRHRAVCDQGLRWAAAAAARLAAAGRSGPCGGAPAAAPAAAALPPLGLLPAPATAGGARSGRGHVRARPSRRGEGAGADRGTKRRP
jgi:hypothetical protein